MRKLIAAAIPLLLAAALCACAAAPQKMTIAPAELTEDEKKIATLLTPNTSYSIFDFTMDDTVKSIQINRYRLENSQWAPAGGCGSFAFDGTNGRIALISDGDHTPSRIALQGESGSSAITYHLPDDLDTAGMTSAAAYLSEAQTIVYEQETPLQIQIFTTQNSISSYDVSTFSEPERYAQYNYEQVYAITITFSQSALS